MSERTELAVGLPPAPCPSTKRLSKWSDSIFIAFKASPTFAKGLFLFISFGDVKLDISLSLIKDSEINLILYPNFLEKLISSIFISEIPWI